MAEAKQVDVRIDWGTEPVPIYSDIAAVYGRPDNFAIAFCAVSPGEIEAATDSVSARVVVSVRISTEVVPKLVESLVSTWNKVMVPSGKPALELKGVPPEVLR